MHTVYLGIGTNEGNRAANISRAIALIADNVGKVTKQSTVIETEPWGFESANAFLNCALCVDTQLEPLDLLEATQQIERQMGRKEKSTDGTYHDRIIDIDILLYDDINICAGRLIVPHPLMLQRDFVMIPLREILSRHNS